MRAAELNALEDEDEELEHENQKLPVFKDPAYEKALKKFDEDIRQYEYKVRFDHKRALAKSGQSYRQARNYLRWAEISMHEREILRAEKEQFKRHQSLVTKRKEQLGPSIGAPTLKNPFNKMIQGEMQSITEGEAVQLQVGRSFALRLLILNNRGFQSHLHPILGSNLAIQLGTYRQISISRNEVPYLLHPLILSGLSLYQLKAVVDLNLTFNDLLELPPDLGCLQCLTKLTLDYNKLRYLPPSIGKITSLTHLSIAQNHLQAFPDYFVDLLHLTHLNASNNEIHELCPTFHLLASLTHLDLSGNRLQHLGILPSPRILLWHRRSCPLDWLAVPSQEPGGQTRYFNIVTGSLGTSKPSALREIEAKAMGGVQGGSGQAEGDSHRSSYLEGIGSEEDGAKSPKNKVLAMKMKMKKKRQQEQQEQAEAWQIGDGESSEERRHELAELARQRMREWDTPSVTSGEPADAANNNGGVVLYFNNLTQQSTTTMPKKVDKIGRLKKLIVLKVNRNQLKALPESIGNLTELQILEAQENAIKRVPNGMKNWTKIQKLYLHHNQLMALPNLWKPLINLEELNVTGNSLQDLPPTLGQCSTLRKLMLGNNSLTRLPYSFGFLSNLRELQVFGNPIIEPPLDMVAGGTSQQLLWFLRRRYHDTLNGPPPAMTVHRHGVCGELLTLDPIFKDEIQSKLEEAVKGAGINSIQRRKDIPAGKKSVISATVDLRLKGLTALPPDLLVESGPNVLHLKSLNLAFNPLGNGPSITSTPRQATGEGVLTFNTSGILVFPTSFCTLMDLNLWRCGLTLLDTSISHCTSLTKLNLDENHLKVLPDAMLKLRKLSSLHCIQNKLVALPDRFGALNSLVELNLMGNGIETLPNSFSKLVALKNLSLARNKLYNMEEFMTKLHNLEVLNLESNKLTFLPDGIGHMRCRSINVSYNRLEHLDEDFIQPLLHQTLSSLRLARNNLIELPMSLYKCPNLKDFTYECNPLKSPPPDLLVEELTSLFNYAKLRQIRVQEVKTLLTEAEFEFVEERLAPTTTELVTGNTDYLLPEDLKEFDEAVDQYVNGPFYHCRYSAEEMVKRLQNLRDERNVNFQKRLLEGLLRVIEDELPDDLYGAGVLVDEIKRPWGLHGETIDCYGLGLHALFLDRSRYEFDDGTSLLFRPALYNKVIDRLPKTPFPYDEEAIHNAAQEFEHPFGRVAYFEMLEYPICECIDPESGEFLDHYPCLLPSMVILRTIYTVEEAERRDGEETEIMEAFKRIEKRVQDFAKSKEGKKQGLVEIKRRRNKFQGVILAREAESLVAKKQQKAIKGKLANLKERETGFHAGYPYKYHRISSQEEVDKLMKDAQEEIQSLEDLIQDMATDTKTLEKERGLGDRNLAAKIWRDLTHKYCYYEAEKVLYIRRREAYRQRWRRPWDGPDGADYFAWMEKKRHAEIPINWEKVHRRINRMEGTLDHDDDEDEDDDDDDDDQGPIDFDHGENMDGYTNIYVVKWLASKEGSFMAEMMKTLEKFGEKTGLGATLKKVKALGQTMMPQGIKGLLQRSKQSEAPAADNNATSTATATTTGVISATATGTAGSILPAPGST